MDWYRFNVKEYRQQTRGLPDAEDLAFRRMIDLYYIGEGPLPLDHDTLEKAVGLDWDCIEPILESFFRPTPKGYINDALQQDVERRIERSETLRKVGRKGGRPRLAKSK